MAQNDNKDPQLKQGAVTPRSLRVASFRGAYRDTRFDNEGLSVGPVSRETEEALRADFPSAKIEVVKAAKSEEAPKETAE